MKNNIKTGFLVVALLGLIIGLHLDQTVNAQVGQIFPNVYQSSSLVVGWTAGTVNNGGSPVSVTASTAAVTIQQDDCSAPLFPECNIVWANSAGSVTVTATSSGMVTAAAAGNTIMALVQTNGSAITSIVYPQQTSYAMKPAAFVYDCGIVVACTSAGATDYLLGSSAKVAFGSAVLTSGTASITGLPFTNSSSYGCTVSFAGTTVGAAAPYATPTSGSALTISMGQTGATTAVQWICVGK